MCSAGGFIIGTIFGISDPITIIGYVPVIILGIAYVAYGAKNWNNND